MMPWSNILGPLTSVSLTLGNISGKDGGMVAKIWKLKKKKRAARALWRAMKQENFRLRLGKVPLKEQCNYPKLC